MEPSDLRAADADRQRVAAQLQRHYVDGRLSTDELSERVDRALAARTFGELEALLRDLPPLPASDAPSPGPADADRADVAEEHARAWDHQDFRRHAITYALVMTVLVAIWLLTSPGGYFWPIWPMLGWGIGVAAHGLSRRGWRVGRAGRGRRRADPGRSR
jgi:hypothetical protein